MTNDPGRDPVASRRVVFTPSGLAGSVAEGTTVLDAARGLGVDLDSVCAGRGICGRCQVVPGHGRFATWGIDARSDALSAPAETERDYRGNRPLQPGHRLGCAARIDADVVVDVPASSQVHRQVVRKDLDLGVIAIDPGFALHYLDLPASRLGDTTTMSGAVMSALAGQHGVVSPGVAAWVLRSLHPALQRGDGAVTVAVERDEELGNVGTVVAAWPGYVGEAYGIAVDIGSTTVAGHLAELTSGTIAASAGIMNPQIRFGEDLMSRVSYVMMNRGGEAELTAAIRRALDDLIGELVQTAGVRRDQVLDLVLVGNPIMHHLVLGLDPTPLGSAPFVLATDEAVTGRASLLDVDLPNASFYVGPCIAGHVGADTAAATLAEGPHRGERVQLMVDVGTNAEIVLGNRERQFAASSPTGPAFEGAQISAGQRATAGAIERVRIDPTTLEPRFKVIGVEPWSDEPGFDVAAAATGVTGICGSGIIDVVAQMFLAGIIDPEGVIRGERAADSDRVIPSGRTHAYVLHRPASADAGASADLCVTQNDVRAIQLAKAALRAGIDLLIEHAGSPVVGDIRLAGAFGAHIDPIHAMVLGLVPDCPVDGVRSVGNAAGVGAVQALLSRTARAEMERVARGVVKIETATEPRFQELFVAAMAFPHASAPSPHLATEVALPPRPQHSTVPGRRRRPRTQETNR